MPKLPLEQDDDPLADARYQDERPQLVGDFGQDSAFATESHPEGLRYGEKRRAPGVEPHSEAADTPPPVHGDISIG